MADSHYYVRIRNATDNGNGYLYVHADNSADDEVTLLTLDDTQELDKLLFQTVWDHNGSINFYSASQGGYLSCPDNNNDNLRIDHRRSSNTIWTVTAGSNNLQMRREGLYMVPQANSLESSSRDPRPVICSSGAGSYYTWVFESVKQA